MFSTSTLEQGDAAADEGGCQPAPAIDILVQDPLRRYGVAHEGERTCGGGDEAYIRVAERKEKREEAQSHTGTPGQKTAFTDHGPDRAAQASLRFDLVKIAHRA